MGVPKFKPMFSYDPSGEALARGHDDHKEKDFRMAMTLFELLVSFYPGHYWMVDADSRKGLARIRIPHFMGPTLSYNLHLDKITSYPEARQAVKIAGGEILERWNIPRSGLDLAAFVHARTHKRIQNINDPIPG